MIINTNKKHEPKNETLQNLEKNLEILSKNFEILCSEVLTSKMLYLIFTDNETLDEYLKTISESQDGIYHKYKQQETPEKN